MSLNVAFACALFFPFCIVDLSLLGVVFTSILSPSKILFPFDKTSNGSTIFIVGMETEPLIKVKVSSLVLVAVISTNTIAAISTFPVWLIIVNLIDEIRDRHRKSI